MTIYLGATQYRVGTEPGEAEWVPVGTPSTEEQCYNGYLAWIQGTAREVQACLQPGDRDVYLALCGQARSGAMDPSSAFKRWNDHVIARCGQKLCRDLYDDHIRRFPDQQACLQPYKGLIIKACEDAHVRHTVSVDQALQNIAALMQKACPPPRQKPPAAPPTNPPRQTPPTTQPPSTPSSPPPTSVPDVPTELLDPGVPGGGGAQQQPPVEQTDLSRYRRDFGSIVGIGLILAGAFTVYRVKRKKPRR